MKYKSTFKQLFTWVLLIPAISFAQDVAQMDTSMNPNSAPFRGSKGFRKLSVGINAGVLAPIVITGGSNDFSRWKVDLGYGANIRYQLTHYFALQIDGMKGNLHGNQDKLWGNGQVPNSPVRAFKTDLDIAGSLSGVLTFGNVNWLSPKNKIVPYLQGGGGIANYTVQISTLANPNFTDYPHRGNSIHEYYVLAAGGLKISLSKMINLDLAYRAQYLDGDNLDGYKSFPHHKDKFSYGLVGVEFSLGKQSKERLVFNNPAASMNLDELNRKYNNLLAMLQDSDGDGVADIFDKEPNTPKGCPVDSHGVMRDTDGDGVPDCRDKQLITPTECQPVDADGVGKCPPPACCADLQGKMNNASAPTASACTVTDWPSISFRGKGGALSSDAKAMLATVGSKLKSNPNCSITLNGTAQATKISQSLCNKRLQAIQSYLRESEGISADRIQVNCQVGTGDINTVDIKSN